MISAIIYCCNCLRECYDVLTNSMENYILFGLNTCLFSLKVRFWWIVWDVYHIFFRILFVEDIWKVILKEKKVHNDKDYKYGLSSPFE